MAPTAQPRRTFPPLITASKWVTALDAMMQAAKQRRGARKLTVPAGPVDVTLVEVPNLTNGDIASLVKAWLEQAGAGGFPLWYQFGAAAYGWDPRKKDRLDIGAAQRDAVADVELSREVWLALRELALDADNGTNTSARLELDAGAFDNSVFQASVRNALVDDGAKAQFKIPVGCKDKKGRPTKPALKCKPGWVLERVPGTLVFVCRNPATGETESPEVDCDPILIDDPITGFKKQVVHELVGIALILALVHVVVTEMGKDK